MTTSTASLLLGMLGLVLPITGILMALTPYLMPKRECFAVTVPDAAVNDSYLRKLKRTYLAAMLVLTALATAATVAACLIDPQHAALPVFIAGIFAVCVIGYGLMLYFRRRVQAYKRAQGWRAEGSRAVGFVGDEPFPRPLSLRWGLLYLPVIAVTIAIAVAGYNTMPDQIPMQIDLSGEVSRYADKSPGVAAFPVLFTVFMAGCFLVSQWMILRSKKGGDPAAPAASAWAYAMFARAQSIMLVAMGLMLSFIGPLMELVFVGVFTLEQMIAPIILIILIVVVASLAVSLIYGQNGSRLIARVGQSDAMPRDDDRFWKLGIFYVNRDDASLFLPERFGIGWTINWGRPAAWALVAGFVLLVAGFVVAAILLT